MGLKHLVAITEILKGAGVPMLKDEIRNDYKIRFGKALNYSILMKTLKHMIDDKKVIFVKPDRYKLRSKIRKGDDNYAKATA